MKKYILLFLLLNIGQVQAHSLSATDRESIEHTHKILSVHDVVANDSQEIWSKLMETEYDAGIKNNYEIEIKYTNKNQTSS